ncbi:DUF4817 domain-containing protein [Trichonephila clavipes]|nr:DUF4817 domain-containing protein [Trichonephila clavipes]
MIEKWVASIESLRATALTGLPVHRTGYRQLVAKVLPVCSRATIDLLKDTFGDRLISRFGSVNWPPRSCDLTPLDYFLWSYVKSLVYTDKPQTLDHLEDNIRRVIADMRPQMLEKVIENWTSRLDYIRASRGSHMTEIIFKISPRHYHLQSSSLQHSHTSTFGAVIAANSSGTRFLEGASEDSPFLPEPLQLSCFLYHLISTASDPNPQNFSWQGARCAPIIIYPNLEGEQPRESGAYHTLPLPSTSRENLCLDGYLEYPHAAKTLEASMPSPRFEPKR